MTINIGDLHANSLKLILILQAYGFASLSPELKKQFSQAYSKNDITLFNEALSHLEFKKPIQKIRFLGDVLADRGNNDWFTLKLLHLMDQHHIDYEIIYSNHDAVFIGNINNLKADKDVFFDSTFFNRSLIALSDTLQSNNYLHQPFIDIIEKSYLPKLKLISLFLDKEGQKYFCSHAPLKNSIISQLCEKYQVSIDAFFAKNTVQIINAAFKQDYLQKQINSEKQIDDITVEYDLIWNRDLHDSDMNKYKNIIFLHGHNGRGESIYPNQINLDNDNGKIGIEIRGEFLEVLEIDEQE